MFLTKVALVDNPDTLAGYLSELSVVHSLFKEPLEFKAPITVITGENGVGKSTLVEALAVGMRVNPAGGSRHANFGHSGDIVSELHKTLQLTRRANPKDAFFFRGETFYNLASYHSTFSGDPLSDLLEMSHGESIMALVERRLRRPGLIILDEPEAGLSLLRQLEFMGNLVHLAAAGSQIIVATHSPILLATPGADIVEVSADGLRQVSFEDTEAVGAAREFLNDPRGTAAFLVEDTQ
ncbi:AAA family ATPase [Corynebacterium callunae]|uniref:AAA family ATPase n=1 Tax=Corynebacterium callunae TaxID=1721 RepID=UPI0039829C50